jgi:segregation and condensation protein B
MARKKRGKGGELNLSKLAEKKRKQPDDDVADGNATETATRNMPSESELETVMVPPEQIRAEEETELETKDHEEADPAQPEAADEQSTDTDDASPEEDTDEDEDRGEEQDIDGLKVIVEALLFVTPEPMTAARISRTIGGTSARQVRKACKLLAEELDAQARSFELREVAGGYQFLTRPDFEPYLRRFKKERDSARLSPAALETLAIIAYRQPIQRAEIENLRGVGCGPIMRTLMDKRLVKIVGRSEDLGRPVLYGTTNEFLTHFGLKNLSDLPRSLEFRQQ